MDAPLNFREIFPEMYPSNGPIVVEDTEGKTFFPSVAEAVAHIRACINYPRLVKVFDVNTRKEYPIRRSQYGFFTGIGDVYI